VSTRYRKSLANIAFHRNSVLYEDAIIRGYARLREHIAKHLVKGQKANILSSEEIRRIISYLYFL
jgi:hypothetical protein